MSISTTRTVEFKDLDKIVNQMRSTVQIAFRDGTAIDRVEEELLAQLLKLGYSLLESLFEAMQHGDVGQTLEHDGRTLRRLPKPTRRPYTSIFGKFDLERFSYGTRQSQAHQAVPFDEHLGLPKTHASLLLESWVGQLSTSESFHEACSKLQRILKIIVHVDSAEGMVDRLGKAAASVLDSQPPIDVASEAEVLIQTSDNKGIVMRNEFPAAPEEPVGAPQKRMAQNPTQSAWLVWPAFIQSIEIHELLSKFLICCSTPKMRRYARRSKVSLGAGKRLPAGLEQNRNTRLASFDTSHLVRSQDSRTGLSRKVREREAVDDTDGRHRDHSYGV